MERYEKLKAWQACHQLALTIHQVTAQFPPSEREGLALDIRRAAFSAPVRLAHGRARHDPSDFLDMLELALTSLNEVAYLLRLSRDLGYLNSEDYTKLEIERDHAGKLTWGLYYRVKKSIKITP